MTDYTELVKALRSASTVSTAFGKLMADAADAIEALQAQLEDKTNSVELWKDMYVTKDLPQDEKDRILAYIRNAPIGPIEPMRIEQLPKRGEWVEENRRPRSSQFVCSECHRTAYDPQPTRDKAWKKRCRYAYCPNCGAKMTEVQDESAGSL